MKIKLVSVGKTREKFWLSAEAEFRKRIQRYASLNDIRIKDAGYNPDKEAERVKSTEAGEILANIQSGEFVIATALEGKHLSSDQFAQFMSDKMLHGSSRFTFVVGGPSGLADSILHKSDFHLALSKMTFVHEMARVILLEQIYRAFTILNGEKYHK